MYLYAINSFRHTVSVNHFSMIASALKLRSTPTCCMEDTLYLTVKSLMIMIPIINRFCLVLLIHFMM